MPALVVGGCLAAISGSAFADDDVAPVSTAPDGGDAVRRGVQGPEGLLAARVLLAMNLSKGAVGEPLSLAPDLFYSVTDRLQLGLVHDGPMRWQSRPGLGLCLTGKTHGCASVYDNIGVDLMYGLAFGSQLHLSAHGAFYVTSFDNSTTMLALGAAGKLHFSDTVALFFDPQIGIELSKRDTADDALFVPLELQFQVTTPTTFKVLSGISGGLSHFGDTVEIPLGLGLVHSFTEHVDLGGRVSFDNLLGHQPDGVGRADARSIALLLLVRN
ncbi:MAG: hypothetical protein K8W52_08270 [Deltaproteobacteria bacterium]|nr:hypothetical protein [Deltaproteobacteria bacterium]